MAVRIAVPNAVIPDMHKAFPVQQRNIYARHVRNMDTLQAYASQSRRKLHIRSQLRRSTITVHLKWMKLMIPIVMTALYCAR